jgi:hypothetical protein
VDIERIEGETGTGVRRSNLEHATAATDRSGLGSTREGQSQSQGSGLGDDAGLTGTRQDRSSRDL